MKTVILAVLLSAGACVRQQPAESVQPAATAAAAPQVELPKCAGDRDCASGFCDRGVCAVPAGVYGRPCEPAPRTKDGLRDAMLNVCGAYLCIEGRCRSCGSDEQCRSELGSPRCYKAEGEPGWRCGDPPSAPNGP